MSDVPTVVNFNGAGLSLAGMASVMGVLEREGSVTVINCAMGDGQALGIIRYMSNKLSDDDKEWLAARFREFGR